MKKRSKSCRDSAIILYQNGNINRAKAKNKKKKHLSHPKRRKKFVRLACAAKKTMTRRSTISFVHYVITNIFR